MEFLHVYYCFYNIFELIKQLAQCDLATNRIVSWLGKMKQTYLLNFLFLKGKLSGPPWYQKCCVLKTTVP